MALTPSTAAEGISLAFQDVAGIDATGTPTCSLPVGDFPADWATAYDDYAAAGVVLGAENSGGTKSILADAMATVTSSPASIAMLANAMANYWATVAVTPGTPSHGGVAVASVVNNAETLVPLFQAAITVSIAATEDKPWFETLVTNIETMAVASIVWTVTELMPPAATPTIPGGD